MRLDRAFTALLCAAALAACEKNAVQDITGPLPESQIKFFNFGVGAPPVNFYANDRKMTAVLSSDTVESTSGVTYGNVGAGDYYTGIDPGQYTLSGRISAAEDKDRPISSLDVTIVAGKKYSYYQSGFYDTVAKSVDAFIVEDDFPEEIDYTRAYVRLVHAIANAEPLTLYIKERTTGEEYVIGGEVAYKSAGPFVPVPNGVYDLAARYAGSDEDVIVRTNVTFAIKKVYTIGARGDMTVTSTTDATRPFLDLTSNR